VSGSDHRIGSKKAGLSGLFRACAIVLLLGFSAPAMAEPISIEVENAEPNFDQRTREPIITLRMMEASRRLFAVFTTKNVGRKVDIRIDGKTVISPVIREPILQGTVQVSNDGWTAAYVRELADRLSAGKSRIEIEVGSE
jgi:preprotein translocase subunit SecD